MVAYRNALTVFIRARNVRMENNPRGINYNIALPLSFAVLWVCANRLKSLVAKKLGFAVNALNLGLNLPVWEQSVACSNHAAPTNFEFGVFIAPPLQG